MNNIFFKSVFFGFVFSLIEFLMVWFNANPTFYKLNFYEKFSIYFLQFGSWAIFFFVVSISLLIICKNLKTIKRAANFFVFLALSWAFSVIVVNFFYYIKNKTFFTSDQIYFILDNYFKSALHLLQTSPYIVLKVVLLSACLSFFLMLFLKNWNPGFRVSSRKAFLILFLFLVIFGKLKTSELFENGTVFKYTVLLSYFFNPPLDFLDPKSEGVPPETFLTKKIETKQLMPGPAIKSPVIVLMIESLRRDLIFNNPTPIPFLKKLAEESIHFDKAYVTSSHSNYADLSVWYSQYPLKRPNSNPFPANSFWRRGSIFSIFKDIGYQTAYISSQNEKWGGMIDWLKVPEVDFFYHSENHDGDTWYNNDDSLGIGKLIKEKIATAGKIEDSQTIKVIQRWIDDNLNKSFFVGANLQNTHFSYVLPPSGVEMFHPAQIDFPMIYFSWPKKKVEVVRNRYLNAVYNVDKIVESFVDFLKNRGIWEKCYFIVIGDSGEAFYEHGFGNHSGPVYDEVSRTFCIIHTPSKNNIIKKIQEAVSHIDIFPTLLDLMGISKPCFFQGISVFDKNAPRKNIFMNVNAIYTQFAILQWPYKYMVTYHPEKKVELYDLDKDSYEKTNIFESNKKLGAKLDKKLRKFISDQF